MNDIDLKAMCDSAMVRVQGWIARSAGQHIRQMREQHRMTDSEFLSDLLYCGFNGELPEATIEEACARFNIPFPPKRYDYSEPLTVAQRLHNGPFSGKANHRQAIQGQQSEALLAD